MLCKVKTSLEDLDHRVRWMEGRGTVFVRGLGMNPGS